MLIAPHLMPHNSRFTKNIQNIKERYLQRSRPLRYVSNRCIGVSLESYGWCIFPFLGSLVDYASPILSMLSPSALKPLGVLQNKAMRIILGCPLPTKILVMRKELDLSCHPYWAYRPRPRISTILSNEYRPRYSSLIQPSLEWNPKIAHVNLFFVAWNIEATNIPETLLSALCHRTHVYNRIDKLPGPKSTLAINSDASTDRHGATLIGVDS